MPPITLYFLQASRAIRIAWLLEELKLPYDVEAFDREPSGNTATKFRDCIPINRAPAIKDGDLTLLESAAITEYLCEQYDHRNVLLPVDTVARAHARMWISASEGTFLVHGLAIKYGSSVAPEAAEKLHVGLSAQVHRDFDWLEDELRRRAGKFLLGDTVTVADIMMGFSVAFIIKMGLGTEQKTWPSINVWLDNIEATPTYQQAVRKTGYVL